MHWDCTSPFTRNTKNMQHNRKGAEFVIPYIKNERNYGIHRLLQGIGSRQQRDTG